MNTGHFLSGKTQYATEQAITMGPIYSVEQNPWRDQMRSTSNSEKICLLCWKKLWNESEFGSCFNLAGKKPAVHIWTVKCQGNFNENYGRFLLRPLLYASKLLHGFLKNQVVLFANRFSLKWSISKHALGNGKVHAMLAGPCPLLGRQVTTVKS